MYFGGEISPFVWSVQVKVLYNYSYNPRRALRRRPTVAAEAYAHEEILAEPYDRVRVPATSTRSPKLL